MYFNCKYNVQVVSTKTNSGVTKTTTFDISTVTSVSVHNDSMHIGADCDVVVPLNCLIQYRTSKNSQLNQITMNVNQAFNSGDQILITANYEGYPVVNIFKGFITDFVMGTPTIIKCSDYIYLLEQSSINVSYKSITLRNLIKNVISNTGITLLEDTFDFQLIDITYSLMSPAAILESIKKEMGLNISLSDDKLYCNLASNTLSTVKFSSDRNVLKCNLQKPYSVFQAYKIKAWFFREDGTKDSYEYGPADGVLHEAYFWKVQRGANITVNGKLVPENYQKLAKEALIGLKQRKYKGEIETLLYPSCDLFWNVIYTDIRYPDRNANYVVTGITTTLDDNGFHRNIKLAYLSDITNG